ncbi:filamentous hemagglutinin N-terminal domain-containing protein [Polynucleobacter sp. JS-Fieb-80-E5]|uniref:two-partner secretion domain-containing protein n=1 Tax=Polynucleobacter sp. JS-Fieb-80-E5 TaxID=2081050 RepID=UPI001C0AD11A|nr:filamentous hemagglutinin N-terminal domain-containing protein [Polynucleobacter sp. JS-Fieb-80-E5]MBU3617850.1 filamentous hemagglutinin N-terminal domain-containing protein [Polynucleobacter sp. JS-Fieb-80-E5]
MNNKAYRLVFSKTRGMLVAVAEIIFGRGKGSSFARSATSKGAVFSLTLFPIKTLALVACFAFGAHYDLARAQALPSGGLVVGGAASINQTSASKMVVTQTSDKAVVNWQNFNVDVGKTLQFVQPSASSQILNRVVGVSGPSQILGTLTANGQVFIVNSQGIVFGNGAIVNVGGLLATTKDLSPSAFMTGGPLTLNGGSNGSGLISNQGSLTATAGFITLVGDQVRNTGTLNAPNGKIALASGDQATLTLSNGQLVQLTIGASANNASITSSGVISAEGGRILLTTNATNSLLNSAMNLSGVVNAQGGGIQIDGGAASNVNIGNAVLNASNTQGLGGNLTVSAQNINLTGNVSLLASGNQGGGTVVLAGNSALANSQTTILDSAINVSGTQANATGGTVVLSGNRIGLFGNSSIDASGMGSGGRVIIGGDRLAKVADIMNVSLANQTYIGANTTVNIGSAQGDGGFVETSGQILTMLGTVGGTSKGKNGQWLIDPTDITINASNTSGAVNVSNTWNGASTTAIVNNASIESALNKGLDVCVTTASSGGAGGNLTVAANIIKTGDKKSNLTLFANQSLNFSYVNVCATGSGSLGLIATAANGTLMLRNTNISLNGGDGNLTGNNAIVGASPGVNIVNSNINVSGGSFNITGTSNNSQGIVLAGGITQDNGTMNMNGTSTSSQGIYVSGSITQANGTMNMNGTSNTYQGIVLAGGNITQNNGILNVNGTSNTASGFGFSSGNITQVNGAMNLNGASTTSTGISWAGGNITQANGNGSLNLSGTSNISQGINSSGGNITQATTTNGTINLNGTSNTSYGVYFSGNNITQATATNGTINLNGTSNTSKGVYFSGGNITQANGTMNVNGSSTSNSNSSQGIYFSSGNITQANGTMNMNGTSNTNRGISLAGGNITQNNGILNVNGRGNANLQGVYLTGGNITQNNGTFNLSGSSNAFVGLTMAGGTITQANGTLNVNGTTTSSLAIFMPGGIITKSDLNSAGYVSLYADSGSIQLNNSISAANLSISTASGNISQASNSKLNVSGNLSILAGIAKLAGDINGGNVTLVSSGVNVGSSSTVTILSGNSTNTLALQGSISGANSTGVNYKTYNASNANIASVAGTRNYYYRNNPNLSINNVSDKVYDTTTNASGNILGGLIDGDTASIVRMQFNSSSAGLRSVNLGSGASFTNANWSVSGYGINSASSILNNATISKANVTLTTNGTVSDKVYDATTNAAVLTNSSGVVQLGNATLANGATTSTSFTNVTTTGSFNNASAGNQKTVVLNNALLDSTNYTIVNGAQLSTTATISKANVTLTTNGTVSDKVYDGGTSATILSGPTGTILMGNSALADGSTITLAPNTLNQYLSTTASFANPGVGNQTVNFQYKSLDPINFNISRYSGYGVAYISPSLPSNNSQILGINQLSDFAFPYMQMALKSAQDPMLIADMLKLMKLKYLNIDNRWLSESRSDNQSPMEYSNSASSPINPSPVDGMANDNTFKPQKLNGTGIGRGILLKPFPLKVNTIDRIIQSSVVNPYH